jgi:plastocyanin
MSIRPLAGLLATLALSAPAATQPQQPDWNLAATAEVTLRSFSFAPNMLRLEAGVPVRLILTDAKGSHNFSAPQFFAAARIIPEDRAKLANGKVELGAGESVTLRLVPGAGTFKFTCTHLLHTSFGMKGRIIVQ